MLQKSDLNNCINHILARLLSFLDLISIARKCSQFKLFDACDSLQFTHFDNILKQDSIDLHIKHISILVSWFFIQYLHFAVVSLQMLIKCLNFWYLWHWLIRLFKNFVTCRILSCTIRSFFNVFSASFFNFRLILTNECVLFSRLSFLVN
jgi:hypothetical protein